MKPLDIGIKIDLERLLETRAMVEADSGFGKTWMLKKMGETFFGKVQQIYIDPEGEFAPLREKFDFALVSKTGGDIPLSIRHAEALALKILELGISVIIDLSEFKQPEREQFVKLFCEALMDAPKKLRHHVIVYFDEAQMFCSEEKGTISTDAVIDVFVRGRKRGICGILATTRISIIKKSALAQCKNKFIGSTSLDIDQKRAGSELGLITKEEIRNLRNLDSGEFYAFGPAISKEPTLFKVSALKTTHISSWKKKNIAAPPTPTAIKKILSKLQEIPQEAEVELKTKTDLQSEVRRLTAELKKKPAPVIPVKGGMSEKDVEPLVKKALQPYLEAIKKLEDKNKQWKAYSIQVIKFYTNLILMTYKQRLSKIGAILDELAATGVELNLPAPEDIQLPKIMLSIPGIIKNIPSHIKGGPVAKQLRDSGHRPVNDKISHGVADGNLSKAATAFLQVACMYYPEYISRARISLISGYTQTSSNFGNTLTELRAKGYFKDGPDKTVAATEDGFNNVGSFDRFPTDPESLKSFWSRKLSKAGCSFFLYMFDKYPEYISREEISQGTGYLTTSSNFGNTLTELRTLGVMQDGVDKTVRVHEDLFNN